MQHRDARSLPALEDLFQDLRFAARLLLKERWFSRKRASWVDIEPSDPATMIGITIVLAGVALASCFIPVRDAARRSGDCVAFRVKAV